MHRQKEKHGTHIRFSTMTAAAKRGKWGGSAEGSLRGGGGQYEWLKRVCPPRARRQTRLPRESAPGFAPARDWTEPPSASPGPPRGASSRSHGRSSGRTSSLNIGKTGNRGSQHDVEIENHSPQKSGEAYRGSDRSVLSRGNVLFRVGKPHGLRTAVASSLFMQQADFDTEGGQLIEIVKCVARRIAVGPDGPPWPTGGIGGDTGKKTPIVPGKRRF